MVAPGKTRDAVNHAIGDIPVGEERAAALRAGTTKTLVDGIDLDLSQELFLKSADREHVFPVGRLAGMTFLAAAGVRVQEIGWRGLQIKLEALVSIRREKTDGLVLKDKVPVGPRA